MQPAEGQTSPAASYLYRKRIAHTGRGRHNTVLTGCRQGRDLSIAIGVDGCKSGWFHFRFEGEVISFGCTTTLAEILEGVQDDACILVDMPIGLLQSGKSERQCDLAARAALSPGRGSSVFPAPCRQALAAPSYAAASAINERVLGRKLSKQTWALAPKIRELDDLLASSEIARASIRETHPEVCFWGLAGGPMSYPKKTRDGFLDRMTILKLIEPMAEEMIAAAFLVHGGFDAARDDVVDAFVAAVCARAAENLRTMPDEPKKDRRGLPMEICYLSGINSVRAR
jgi:predicted RNase H-like nuclease